MSCRIAAATRPPKSGAMIRPPMTSLLSKGRMFPTKPCRGCGRVKVLTDFHSHPMMADGHLNHCKECKRVYGRSHRLKNLDRIREYDRNRPNAEQRAAENKIRSKERGYHKG